jgi:hypothetical protein
MLKYLRDRKASLKTYFIQNQHSKILSLKLEKPLPDCGVCSERAFPVTVECNFKETKLQDIVKLVQEKSPELEEFSLSIGAREVYNFDEPKLILLNKTLLELSQS